MSMEPLAGAQVRANASHSVIIVSRLATIKSERATRASTNCKPLPDRRQEILVSDWLGDVAITAGGTNAFFVALHCQGGKRNYRNTGRQRAGLQETDRLQPVHSRELDVHQDERGLLVARHRHARFRISGLENAVPLRLEQKCSQ